MNTTQRIARTLLTVLFAAMTATARADFREDVYATIDSPKLKQAIAAMTPQERATLADNPLLRDGHLTMTFYVSGPKTRIDFGPTHIIQDAQVQKSFILLPEDKAYVVGPYRLEKPNPAKSVSVKMEPSNQTQTLLGYTAHKFLLSGTTSKGIPITGDVWIVPELPSLPNNLLPTTPGAHEVWQQVKGQALQMTLVLASAPQDQMTVTYTVKSYSAAPLPLAVFAIPTGYEKLTLPK